MVCISSLLLSCNQRPHRANQCGLPSHPRNTSQGVRTSSSLWSKPEPSVFEKWPVLCTSRRASSSTGTTPIHMRIRSFLCPSSAEGPARSKNPSPVWRRTWRHQVSRGSRLFAVSDTRLLVSLRSSNESRNRT